MGESSEFMITYYSILEDMEAAKPANIEELDSLVEGWKSEINMMRDLAQEALDNLPEQFQEADSGQKQQERIDVCDEWESALDSIDFDWDKEEGGDEEEFVAEKLQEVRDTDPGTF